MRLLFFFFFTFKNCCVQIWKHFRLLKFLSEWKVLYFLIRFVSEGHLFTSFVVFLFLFITFHVFFRLIEQRFFLCGSDFRQLLINRSLLQFRRKKTYFSTITKKIKKLPSSMTRFRGWARILRIIEESIIGSDGKTGSICFVWRGLSEDELTAFWRVLNDWSDAFSGCLKTRLTRSGESGLIHSLFYMVFIWESFSVKVRLGFTEMDQTKWVYVD